MNEMRIFNNSEFGQVRTVIIDGEPWFVGKDVAVSLGYSNSKKALADHVDAEDKLQGDGVTIRDLMGREQHPTVINESGVYSLIFGSKFESAKRFKRWVTSEVLPSIRKTGRYDAQRYAPKATSVGEIVNLVRVTRETMQDQGCSAEDIAKAVKEICEHFGINLPKCFIKPKETTLKDVYDMIDFVFAHKNDKTPPTYDDFLVQSSILKLKG